MAPLGINEAVKELLIFNLTTQILLVRRRDEAQKTHLTAASAVLAPLAKKIIARFSTAHVEKTQALAFFLVQG